MTKNKKEKINLAIFASGSGTNAENIINYFAKHPQIQAQRVLSNKATAGVHERVNRLGIPSSTFNKEAFIDQTFLKELQGIDFIILAGFLWLIPPYLIQAFPNRIINIHPALLPKFGGKGMYGHRVHEAVIEAGEAESGITIHLVNEQYDEGEVLFQAKCEIKSHESADMLAAKIHSLEYKHFPVIIEKYIETLSN